MIRAINFRFVAVALPALLALVFLAAPQAQAVDLAIVVHSGVPIDNLTLDQLRNVLLGERQYWVPGMKITLLIRAPIAAEREVLLDKVYHMGEAQFRQYWIGKVFRAEVNTGPKITYSTGSAVELVAAIPGSVTFVPMNQVPKGLKILRIDGHLPGEKGYPLHSK
jgi:ABC-type phosphate transport system substrate-binding protein